MKYINFAVILFLVCGIVVANADVTKVPVQYGGDENMDACSSVAKVINLGKSNDEFLAVKKAPNLKAVRTDKLHKGQIVWICEEQKDWYGVVYTKNKKQECGVLAAVKMQKPYMGPCQSGWVSKKYIKLIAG